MQRFRFPAFVALLLTLGSIESKAGLLAYYPFDSNFTDASGNGNNLSIAAGTPTITAVAAEHVFGIGALDVDSTISTQEYLNLASPITFGATDAWSVSFWARRRPGTDDRSGMVLGNPANSNDFIWLSNNAAQVQGLRFRSTDNQNANFGGFPDDGLFHHWVLVSDGTGTISAYRDKVAQTPVTVAGIGSLSITSVAHAYNSAVQSMDGQIDELYIYDEAINAAKVTELFNGGVAALPLAHYSFDADFTDASGNGNHLSIAEGTPTITTASGDSAVGVGALDLDSTISTQEYLNLTSPITFGATNAWSVSFWARRRPGTDNRSGMVIGDLTASDFIWLPDNPAVVDGIRFRNSSSGDADYTGISDDNQFHHWVLAADGAGSLAFYRDNIPLGTKSLATTFNITSVGQAYNSFIQSMDGQIDDLYIFGIAISATKVNELYAAGGDAIPPTLAASGIVDNKSGGPVVENTLVTYTVTFSEDMDAATVEASDFGNAGTALVSIGTVTETSPGVFSVPATPTSPGSLQLEVIATAELKDVAGNPLDTSAPIPDDTTITVEADTAPPTGVTRLRVYLLGGQSNADGRADPSGLPTSPVNLQLPQDDVDFYQTGLTTLRPLAQFGPEITLGRRLADSIGTVPGTRIAIIKYGVGGTSLEVDWKAGGDATTTGDGPRYVSFQNVVTNGLNALAAAYPGAAIEIDGMLWVQGERDCVTGVGANYEANLTAFIADVRATYGSELLFMVSRLSSGQTSLNATQLALVRAAQTAVAAADPLATLIDTDSYGIKTDFLHFDASGQQAIGNASAGGLLSFLPFTSPPTIARLGNGDIEITVTNAFSGFSYILENSGTLAPGGWSDGDSKTATVPTVVLTYTPGVGETKRFFRVKRSSAP